MTLNRRDFARLSGAAAAGAYGSFSFGQVLLAQESLAEFDDAIDKLAEANQDRMRFRFVGPQAPYDFVPEM